MQNILLKGACKLQKSYTYIFRLKREHEIKHFKLTKCKIFLGKVACKLQKSYILGLLVTYEFRLNMFKKKRPEIKLAYLTKMQNFLRQAVVQPTLPKIFMYTYTFRLKWGLKLSILARKMQTFLRQGGITPSNSQVLINLD